MSAHLKPVVVGVDGSPGSLAALRFAAADAAARGTALRLVHAISWPADLMAAQAEYPVHVPHPRAFAEHVIAEAVGIVQAEYPSLTIDAHTVFGSAAAALLIEAEQAALVVVGSRGRGGFTGLLAGSTSTHVAVHAHGPVVVVRGEHRSGDPVRLGVDACNPSAAAIEFAFEEAALRAAPLYTLYAWSTANVTAAANDPDSLHDFDAATREARRLLSEALAGWRDKYPSVRVVEDAQHSLDPANALVRASGGSVLTVVGSRGKSEIRGLLLGSCGRHLVHHALSPVAVVPG
jgi:nucleotide-binding universal stress UspA family protein